MRERLRAWWTPRNQMLIGFGGGIAAMVGAGLTGGHWISNLFFVVQCVLVGVGSAAVHGVTEDKFGPPSTQRYKPATKSDLLRVFRRH